jgi:hypothetical protein
MRGGKRPGAGRKKGIPNKASAAQEFAAQASGETPADVLLGAMREFWRLAKKSTNVRKRSEHLRAAAAIARDAAPYFHARRASTASQPNGNGDEYNCSFAGSQTPAWGESCKAERSRRSRGQG